VGRALLATLALAAAIGAAPRSVTARGGGGGGSMGGFSGGSMGGFSGAGSMGGFGGRGSIGGFSTGAGSMGFGSGGFGTAGTSRVGIGGGRSGAGAGSMSRGTFHGFPAGAGNPFRPPVLNRAPINAHTAFFGVGHVGFGSSGQRFFCHNHQHVFGFFFVPILAYDVAYPWWYDYPYVEDTEAGQPDVEEFDPFYTPWSYSESAGAYLSEYFVTPDAWLVAMVYVGQPQRVYFFDPIGRRFVGVLDRASGDFQHRLGDERWSDPVAFPFVPPPPIEIAE
jgi:hypothetical protein